MIAIDVAGARFGLLTAIAPAASRTRKRHWLCRCDCGQERAVLLSNLRTGNTASCGCQRKAATAARSRTHGRTRTPEYAAWMQAVQRCTNPNNPRWVHYGFRGITICERWRRSFSAFFEDMGERPTPEHSIDRVNNDCGYSPENCRWATRVQQANNKQKQRAS